MSVFLYINIITPLLQSNTSPWKSLDNDGVWHPESIAKILISIYM